MVDEILELKEEVFDVLTKRQLIKLYEKFPYLIIYLPNGEIRYFYEPGSKVGISNSSFIRLMHIKYATDNEENHTVLLNKTLSSLKIEESISVLTKYYRSIKLGKKIYL